MPDEAFAARLRGIFSGELGDAVRALNEGVPLLEDQRSAKFEDRLRELFRVAHGLKGAALAAKVPEAADSASRLEDLLGAIRDGAAEVDRGLIATLLAHVDELDRVRDRLDRAEGESSSAAAGQGGASSLAFGGPAQERPTVRIGAAKLDEVISGAGEVVDLAERVAELARRLSVAGDRVASSPEELRLVARDAAGASRELTRLSSRLAVAAQALTFRPFADAVDGLERTVREQAAAAGKQVRFEVTGTDVELDRAVVGALREPLLHLVRNAVDHGIEPPDVRRAAGKDPVGLLRVTARSDGSTLKVEVADDGAGVDRVALRSAAARVGRFDPDEELVFAPGVTTKPRPDETSGRGVGLDAVRDRVQAIGGTVRLTTDGRGTTVGLVCPLSLALVRVLVVESGGALVCLPISAVARVVRCERAAVREVDGRPTAVIDETGVPVIDLSRAAGLGAGHALRRDDVTLVVVGSPGRPVGLAVDAVVDEAEVVVKPLPARLEGLDTVIGVATRGGAASLVLNVGACVSAGLAAPHVDVDAAEDGPPPPRRVLLAEDTLTTRVLETRMLEAAGYEVTTATDGAEAWDLLRQHGADILVTDVHMPRMDGIELCRRVRGSEMFRDLPVVLVTSLRSPEDRARGLDAGATAYVVKSELVDETLPEVLERLL